MKILLIANYVPDAQQSMARYAGWLAGALRSQGHLVTLLTPPVVMGKLLRRPASLAKWLGYIDKFVIFPFTLRRRAKTADVVHICDHGNAMYVRHLMKVPHLVTCHDLFAIRISQGEMAGKKTGLTGRIFQRLISDGLKKARLIVCVSQSTRDDLCATIPVSRPPLVVEHPLNWPYKPMGSEAAWKLISPLLPGLTPPFLLHVGGNQWYKNRPGVVRIFAQLRKRGQPFSEYPLVMVGKPFTDEIKAALTPEVSPHVHSLVSVENAVLQALYSVTEALLFPSLAEGFGWPVVEAQACGALVITSNRPPMNQIAGDAAILVDPADPEQAAACIEAAWENRNEVRKLSLENAKRFSDGAALEGYLNAYQISIASFTGR